MRVALFLCLFVSLGCGGPKFAPVSGRVTLDTKPLVNAMIVFQPLTEDKNPGPGSFGKTDADGQFSLQMLTGETRGALVGRHKVSITAYEGDGSVQSSGSDIKFRKALLPDEYNAKSKLTFDVPAAGSAEANFELSSSKAK